MPSRGSLSSKAKRPRSPHAAPSTMPAPAANRVANQRFFVTVQIRPCSTRPPSNGNGGNRLNTPSSKLMRPNQRKRRQ